MCHTEIETHNGDHQKGYADTYERMARLSMQKLIENVSVCRIPERGKLEGRWDGIVTNGVRQPNCGEDYLAIRGG